MEIQYQRDTSDGGTATAVSYRRSRPEVALNSNDLAANLEDVLRQLNARDESFVSGTSGWKICNVSNFVLHVAQYHPLGGTLSFKHPLVFNIKRPL